MPETDNRHEEIVRRFAEQAHRILTARDPETPTIRDAADALGCSYEALYARLDGRNKLKATDMVALLEVVGDPRLANVLLACSQLHAVERVSPDGPFPTSIHIGASLSVVEATDVLKAVVKGLEDKKIDHRDRSAILQEIEIAERVLASLRHAIETGVAR